MRTDLDRHTFKDILSALWVPLIGVGIMALLFIGEDQGFINLRPWGIRPREAIGLIGIVLSPFLHASVEHLFNNSLPLLVLGWALFYFYPTLAWRTILWIVLCGGIWVWLSGRADTNHIGASGLLYGLVSFLFFSGILRGYKPLIAISLLVIFMYGSLVWGILPVQEHVSWEGHLWGGIAGTVMAIYYRPVGPQRPRFEWEDEEDVEIPEEEQYWNRTANRDATLAKNARPYRIVYHMRNNPVTPSPPSLDETDLPSLPEEDKPQD